MWIQANLHSILIRKNKTGDLLGIMAGSEGFTNKIFVKSAELGGLAMHNPNF